MPDKPSSDSLDYREALEEQIILESWRDQSFRKALLLNPRAAIEARFNADLPDNIQIVVVEEAMDKLYFVLLGKSDLLLSSDQLSDDELDAVAGGNAGDTTDYVTNGS